MGALAIDDAAWASRWRTRPVGEKAVLSIGLLLVAATTQSALAALAVLIVVLFVALAVARVDPRTYVRAMTAPAVFISIGALTVGVTIGGDPGRTLWSLGPIGVTDSTLALAILVAIRSAAAVSALILLATTTPMTHLLTGLRRLRVPGVVVDIAGLIYRMLFTLMDSVGAVREAQTARLGYSSGPAARRSLGMLAAAVLSLAFSRARRLEEGLAGRGYASSLATLTAERPVSWSFVAASTALAAAAAAFSVMASFGWLG